MAQIAPSAKRQPPADQPDEFSSTRHTPASRVCVECDGQLLAGRHETYCERCGLIASEDHIDYGPTLADVGHGINRTGRPRLETASPYYADPYGSTFSFSYFDAKGNPLSLSQLRRVRRMERRLTWERDSRDQLVTDALKDIKAIGRSAGLPRFVWTHATDRFRDALDAGLAGGRMAYESLAVGALIVAAREAGCPHSIDAIATWARTPDERACAGARKVRLSLGLADECPPVRPDAVDIVVEALAEDGAHPLGSSYPHVRDLAYQLMTVADDAVIGPGTPRLTVATAAVYAADKLLGERRLTQQQLVMAVSPIVETTTGKLSRYNCELIEAYEEQPDIARPPLSA